MLATHSTPGSLRLCPYQKVTEPTTSFAPVLGSTPFLLSLLHKLLPPPLSLLVYTHVISKLALWQEPCFHLWIDFNSLLPASSEGCTDSARLGTGSAWTDSQPYHSKGWWWGHVRGARRPGLKEAFLKYIHHRRAEKKDVEQLGSSWGWLWIKCSFRIWNEWL